MDKIMHYLSIEDFVFVKDHLHHLLINVGQGTRGIKLNPSSLFLLYKNKKNRFMYITFEKFFKYWSFGICVNIYKCQYSPTLT